MLFMPVKPYISEINRLENKSLHYFAAANTHQGFVSFFDTIFDPERLAKIYILKGGPGVGKSTLMKKAASFAEDAGIPVTYYHCSSDPKSLDGVLFPTLGKAILDGTAPHTTDPRYAGVKEILVPLGDAWDTAKLRDHTDDILLLSKEKRACYEAAYRFLAAAYNAEKEKEALVLPHLDEAKMKAAITRFCTAHFKKAPTARATLEETGLYPVDALSCDGAVRFFTPEKISESVYFLKDAAGVSSVFLKELRQAAERIGVRTLYGVEALDPSKLAYIRFPEESLCVSKYDEDFCLSLDRAKHPYKLINLARFVRTDAFGKVRAKYRFVCKCRESLMGAAFEELKAAGLYHGEMETLYGEATDYAVVAKMGDRVIREIFEA